jgi:hypothetical protein
MALTLGPGSFRYCLLVKDTVDNLFFVIFFDLFPPLQSPLPLKACNVEYSFSQLIIKEAIPEIYKVK